MSSRVVIDPDGDVLLQLHQEPFSEVTSEASDEKTEEKKPETLELTVSSKVLSLTSPVFKAMLDGKFKEGIELAEKKASYQSYTLPLPDDREATAILVRVLHFNLTGIPEKPTPICLEKLAFLCDKYQCIDVMKYCGALWLRDWLLEYNDKDPTIDDLCRLLIFAYVVDLPKEFTDTAWKLFLHHQGPFLSPYTQAVILVDHPLLHQDLAHHLNATRFKFCQSFYRGMMAPLNQDWKTLTGPCYAAAKAVGSYFDSLRTEGILPQDLEFTGHKFCDLIQKVSRLAYVSPSQQRCSYKCPCQHDSIRDLTSNLKHEVRLIKEQQKTFICLDCVKTDGNSKGEGKCRISHS